MKALRRFNQVTTRHPGKTVLVFAVLVVLGWALFVPQDPPDLGIAVHTRSHT
jgi:hypothetical protein